MKSIIFITILLFTSIAYAEPFIELRYALFSNKPSVIGNSECPCYASEIIIGYEHKWDRLNVEFTNSWIYQTRWDDPEGIKTNIYIDYNISNKWIGLFGYEIQHNLDRKAIIPYNSQIEWNGDYYGLSGLHYLWIGMRYTIGD